MNKLRIFAASPSDLSAERAQIDKVAADLKPIADYLDIVLDVVDWGAVVPDMGRPEQIILDQLKPTSWDVFIGLLWHRFGTPPGGQDLVTKRGYLSGTEEEFNTAYHLWQQHQKPRILMYRCKRAFPFDLDADQYKRVQEFFKQFEAIEGKHPGLYQTFETSEEFQKLLLKNLQGLLIEYGRQIKGSPIAPEVVQALTPKSPDNLPRRAAFFGRDRELRRAMQALNPADRTWGLLIDGIGGIGKSALAVEAAYRCKDEGLFDAFIFISAKQNVLAPGGIRTLTPTARTLDEFLNETARVLGLTGIAQLEGDSKRRALLDVLRSTPTLLVYDNLETLTQEAQEELADFLRELPLGCKAIMTSRRRGGEGALWLRLEKLEWDAAQQIIEDEVQKDERLKAKLENARGHWPELYEETKGSPLALVHVLGLMRTRATLTFDGALQLLRGNRDSDLQQFVFREAQKELGSSESAALRALAFFVPTAPFEALPEVANLSRNALEMALDHLDALSLLEKLDGTERYALHPLTRSFVHNALLGDTEIAQETGRRFSKYWVDFARRYGGDDSYQTYDRLEAEWANLDAAANWLWQTIALKDDTIRDKEAARMLSALANAVRLFLLYRGRWGERVELSTQTYEVESILGNGNAAGWRAYDAAWIHYNRARITEAEVWLGYCTKAWTQGGGRFEHAIAARLRGLIAQQKRHFDEASRFLNEALVTFRELGNLYWINTLLNNLGRLSSISKDYDGATRYYREALDLAQKADSKERQEHSFRNLGKLAFHRQQWTEARKWFEQALVLARELRRIESIAQALGGLASTWEAEGRADVALPLAQEALVIHQRLQDRNLAKASLLVERLRGKVQ